MHTKAAIAAIILAAGLPARADDFSWAAGNGVWSTPTNWAPNGVPGTWDDIHLGNLPGIQNFTVFLTAGSGYGNLYISSGMTLDMNHEELVSFGDAWITGAGSRLIVYPHLGLNVTDFQGILHVGAGATIDLRDNAPIRIFNGSESSGTITGRGNFEIAADDPFSNDGHIRPGANGGLTVSQFYGGYPIDLDGATGGGHLDLDIPFSVLTVSASGLTDTFSGTITMVPGALLDMQVGPEWETAFNAYINIVGSGNPNAASQINGSDLVLNSALHVGLNQAHLRLLSPVTVEYQTNVDVDPLAWLEFSGPTTVTGGAMMLGVDGKLEFDGPTTIEDGQFTTPSADVGDGYVAFNGATEWRGDADIDGVAVQNGDATVNLASTITADLYDISGLSGLTEWNINATLTLNVGSIGTGQVFPGTMTIANGIIGRLALNSDPWSMTGTLNLVGTGPIYANRLAGAPMTLAGDLNISNFRSEITADLTVSPGATVNFTAPTAELRLRGHTGVRENSSFAGSGQLINGPGGELTLFDTAALSQVGLLNQGELRLLRSPTSDQPATAFVDRFTNEGALRARLAGYTQGVSYDYLKATGGTASLGGELRVELLPGFAPVVGDQFTIISAPGGVSGAFANDPVTHVLNRAYEWSVIYNPTNVVLRLDSITTCYANCNLSTTPPILNVQDFACFINKFAAGDPYANCDGSTTPPVLNVQDFACFLNAFAAGCP